MKIRQYAGQPFSITAKEDEAEIFLYGAIGASYFEDSISAAQFNEAFKKIPKNAKKLTVRINSPGGDVFDGIAIYNRIKQHSAKKTIYVDGLAASIASIIALSGDDIVMGEGALYMIHLPWTFAMGNRKDLESTTMRLMDVEEQMISIYSKASGLGRSEIKKMLEDETWLDASSAIEMGFATSSMEDTTPIAASMVTEAKWINKVSSKVMTKQKIAEQSVIELKDKITNFLARKNSAAK